ncbi:MAG: Holliday junction branch migration protein RuvA [Parachlamydiales bacterium]|nr:Holliday junction branch migration protein RuvA [Parachlamydiales bacterium]
MYAYIKGILIEVTTNTAIVDVHGLGYRLSIPQSSFSNLPAIGKEVLFHTTLIIREDAHTLYGFISREEKTIFELLLHVSGIGPKTALSITGNMDTALFHQAIQQANPSLLCKIPGIGKKTAERLIVELKDKCSSLSFSPTLSLNSHSTDAIAALLHLGYPLLKVQKAVQSVLEECPNSTTSSIVTAALKKI